MTAKKSASKPRPARKTPAPKADISTAQDPKGYFDPSVLGPNRQARRSDPTGQERTLDAVGNPTS